MTCPHCGRPSPPKKDNKTCPRRYHPRCAEVARARRRQAAYTPQRSRERKKSGAPGSRHGNTWLTEADVVVIRAAHAAGARVVDLAREYKMTSGGMMHILAGRTWRHV